MPGPLPNAQRRRTNAPTIPTTSLPAEGFVGPIPSPPKNVPLDATGKAWWRWAWRTPHAAAWASGMEQVIARRASLEDDLATIRDVEGLDLGEVLDAESERRVKVMVQRLAALATGRLSILREMRELDDRLGLTPKSMASLRWTIAETVEAKPALVSVPDRWRTASAG